MLRTALPLTVAVIATAATATTAMACSCLRFEDAAAQYKGTDILFEGRVETVRNSKDDAGHPTAETRFTVTKTLKGIPFQARDIDHSTETGGACGMRFTKGKTYFVGAHIQPDGRVTTSSCSSPQFPVADFEAVAAGGK